MTTRTSEGMQCATRTIRELGGEIYAELAREFAESELPWKVRCDIVDLVMAVLARHDGVVLQNDSDIPVLPLADNPGSE